MSVAELVVGEPIRGSWWAHPQSDRIFATINALADSPDVTRLRLINRRITLVHRRLWASLLCLEARLPSDALLVVVEEHTPSGAHRVTNVPLASWWERRPPGGRRARRTSGGRIPAGRAPRPPVVGHRRPWRLRVDEHQSIAPGNDEPPIANRLPSQSHDRAGIAPTRFLDRPLPVRRDVTADSGSVTSQHVRMSLLGSRRLGVGCGVVKD